MRFALDLPDLARPAAPPPPPPPDPALLAAERAAGDAAGHARGFAEGLAEGQRRQQAAQEARIAEALAATAAALSGAAEAGRRAAEDAAEALAGLLLAAMDAALPGSAEAGAEERLPRVIAPLLPAIADRPEARLRVAPALVQGIAARLPPGGPEVVGDAAIRPGDARLEWRDGAQLVSLGDRRAALRAALRSAGFVLEGDEE